MSFVYNNDAKKCVAGTRDKSTTSGHDIADICLSVKSQENKRLVQAEYQIKPTVLEPFVVTLGVGLPSQRLISRESPELKRGVFLAVIATY